MQPKVALFSGKHCRQVDEISRFVREEGADPVVCRSGLGGENGEEVSLSSSRMSWGGVDFSEIKALHIRCISQNTSFSMPPVTNAVQYEEFRTSFMREQFFQGAAFGFFEEFARRGGLVVNSPFGAYVDHDTKAQLCSKLRENGFDAPRSIMTNSPDEAARFISLVGEAVCKPSIGVGSTRAVLPDDIRESSDLPLCPVLFQEYVRGKTLRVHVVGDSMVLALEIIAPDVDSRTSTKGFERFIMPPEEKERIVQATRFLGLHYAAWDVMASADGRYVYLDCNPGPYVMWIGKENRALVFRQLARYLVGYARTGSVEEASALVKAGGVHDARVLRC
ncbi:ATP-grasp domain-containing protein [Maridesulfovibrio sp.]|uniref:ATP-grasp domain-containing protein n=1 Tax=Maridesulfovibrio sp. TaxID=2795000 RepID=UPI002A187787|nr:ATP-grasp domain-containing protein [Maridesulfovibrio sp.]